MQLHVKGKNLEVSDSIRSYAERKLAKLDRQLSPLAEVEVELAVERNPSIAESQVALQTEVRQGRKDLDGILKNHEKRITRLEASDARKRMRKGR